MWHFGRDLFAYDLSPEITKRSLGNVYLISREQLEDSASVTGSLQEVCHSAIHAQESIIIGLGTKQIIHIKL